MRPCFFLLVLVFTFSVTNAATVDTINVYSKAMNKEIRSVIIVPAKASAGNALPVLYLLHGFGGNYALWITQVPQLQQLADKYGCFIVCPDGGYTTLYFDNPVDTNSRFETHFISELIPFVESHYKVSRDRKYRAISGLSMGGFGAFLLASRHIDIFSAAGSMSGVLDLKPFSNSSLVSKKMVDSTCCRVNWDKFSTLKLGDTLLPGQIRLTMECGLDDYLLSVNRKIHKRLAENKIAHDYAERPGKHDWNYWRNAVEFQLLFFRKGWDEN